MEYVPGQLGGGDGLPRRADGPRARDRHPDPGRVRPARRAPLGRGPPRREAGEPPRRRGRRDEARRLRHGARARRRPGSPPRTSGSERRTTPRPEIWRGEAASPASDVYSLGATYFHLLTARPPFPDHDVASVEQAHLRAAIPDPRELVPSAPHVLLPRSSQRALAKSPRERARLGAGAPLGSAARPAGPRLGAARRAAPAPDAGARSPSRRPRRCRRRRASRSRAARLRPAAVLRGEAAAFSYLAEPLAAARGA